ncbi:MAG: transcriptional regulator [Rhodospirillales bacterium 69-11]|jgi:transcriptional regulator with XRE-family HTH domain|nr:MAG: transcriptional regulator [Rhodospirillales bacterium 69-11]
MGWKEIVGTNIRRQRKALGASQEQLAAEAKIAMRHLGFIERGQINASIEVIGRIADALDISPGKLFEPTKGKR